MNKYDALRALADGKTVRDVEHGAPFRLHQMEGFQFWTGSKWRRFRVGFESWPDAPADYRVHTLYEVVDKELPL
jgi:hypothetical protein